MCSSVPCGLHAGSSICHDIHCHLLGLNEELIRPHDETSLDRLFPAGVIARTVSDVAFFNALFSDCQEAYPEVGLKGLRVGYPTNFWADLGDEVSACS